MFVFLNELRELSQCFADEAQIEPSDLLGSAFSGFVDKPIKIVDGHGMTPVQVSSQ